MGPFGRWRWAKEESGRRNSKAAQTPRTKRTPAAADVQSLLPGRCSASLPLSMHQLLTFGDKPTRRRRRAQKKKGRSPERERKKCGQSPDPSPRRAEPGGNPIAFSAGRGSGDHAQRGQTPIHGSRTLRAATAWKARGLSSCGKDGIASNYYVRINGWSASLLMRGRE